MDFSITKRSFMRFAPLVAGLAAVAAPTLAAAPRASMAAAATDITIYGDSLTWDNWSWNTTINPNDTSPVAFGSRSMSVKFNSAWAGLAFRTAGVATPSSGSLNFSVVQSSGPTTRLQASLYTSAGQLTQVNVASYGSVGPGGWFNASIPLSALNGASKTIVRVQLQDLSGTVQPLFNLDKLTITSSGTSTPPPSVPPPPGGSYFKPAQAPEYIDAVIRAASIKYNLPRWFYYSLIQRESSFDPNSYNGRDQGLTQLGGPWYTGMPYPEGLSSPNDNYQPYADDMNFGKYGKWILMSKVLPMNNPYDPKQNIDRFSTGYAVPAFNLFKSYYGGSDAAVLRRVAFHWNKGMYKTFDVNDTSYLGLYDNYVGQFKAKVEATDGVWNGVPRIP